MVDPSAFYPVDRLVATGNRRSFSVLLLGSQSEFLVRAAYRVIHKFWRITDGRRIYHSQIKIFLIPKIDDSADAPFTLGAKPMSLGL